MVTLHVMGADFTLKREIAGYKSLRIKREWRGPGEFELHTSSRNSDVLTRDSIIIPPGSPDKTMIIEAIKITDGEMTVSGTMANGILKRRICVPGIGSDATYGYDRIIASTETVIKHYVSVNCVDTESARRAIGCLVIEPDEHRGIESMPWSARFDNLSNVCNDICVYADCGYLIRPDFAQKKLVFCYSPGRDLVNGAQRVTFSAAFGNVSSAAYTEDAKSSQSAIYIGGAGEDEQRAIISVGDAAGLDRREMWAEAGSISDPEELAYEAAHRLSAKPIARTIDADVIAIGAAQYERDWDLGDLVTVEAAGQMMQTRITQVQEIHESGRPVTLSVMFGDPPAGIVSMIREATKKEAIR